MSTNNPFPGLRPFNYEDNHLFFGRDEQITDLASRLRKNRFVAVVGTPGAENHHWCVQVCFQSFMGEP